MSYSGSFGSSGRLVLPPTKNKRATPHIPHKGSLHPPDQVQLAIRQLYLPLYEYLCQDGHRPQPSNSASMRKLQDLDPRQLLELMTDASDEILRREPEVYNEPAEEPFLAPQAIFTPGRNESRQMLATLKSAWLQTLVRDVWSEVRRRFPEFRQDETRVQPEKQHHGVSMQENEDQGHQGPGMIDLNDLQSSVAGTSSVQPPPPPHGYQSDHTGSEKETVLMSNRHASKPEWLEAAEEKVKQHLGPGRSSHDFAHADRIRRQALCLAKIQSRTHGHVDMRVVELSALFVTATCDPKHHVEDPKDFVKAFASEQPGCLDSEQLELVVRITRATGVKKEERRRREKRETDWHRTCRELHCVQDADKLEMLGVFGILRTTATFGSSHKPLFNDEGDPSGARKPSHAIGHMQEKERLLSLMRTAEGRSAAAERWSRMQQFIKSAADEFNMLDFYQ